MSPYFTAGEGRRRSVNNPKKDMDNNKMSKVSHKRKRSSQLEPVSSKRRPSESEKDLGSAKKSSRKSIRPIFYKEIDSEDSQTDEDELVRIVEERFGESEEVHQDDND